MPDPDVVDGAILSNAADHLHAVFRAPDRPASTTPATTLSNADPVSEPSGGDGTSGALLQGLATHTDAMSHSAYVRWQRSCLAEMMRLLRPDGAIFYNHKWRVQKGLLQDWQDIVA